jgi:hypothetical protein
VQSANVVRQHASSFICRRQHSESLKSRTKNGHRTDQNATRLPKCPKARMLEFIDENGGGPGVRLRKRHQKKA